MTIYLLRHASTEANDASSDGGERFRGWSNGPLSSKGVEEAKESAAALKKHPPDVIFSSDLQRSKETARVISDELGGIQVHALPDLRTWNIGKFTNQLVSKYGPEVTRYQQTPNQNVPGGEAYGQFYRRFKGAWERLTNLKQSNPLLVLHGRQLWSLPSILTNGKLPIPFEGPPNPGDILAFDDGSLDFHYKNKSGRQTRTG